MIDWPTITAGITGALGTIAVSAPIAIALWFKLKAQIDDNRKRVDQHDILQGVKTTGTGDGTVQKVPEGQPFPISMGYSSNYGTEPPQFHTFVAEFPGTSACKVCGQSISAPIHSVRPINPVPAVPSSKIS